MESDNAHSSPQQGGLGKCTWLSSSPSDFSHFVVSTRSQSRSLSPQREIAQLTKPPELNVIGGPVWDPVQDAFLCFNLHTMERICSFDGFPTGFSCNFCSRICLPPKPQEKSEKDDRCSCIAWYRCEYCDVDICEQCIGEVRADSRCHKPCLVCANCDAFVNTAEIDRHVCRKRGTR